jgi:hypothetical protein
MRNFWGLEVRNLLLSTSLKDVMTRILLVAFFCSLATSVLAQPANDNFTNAVTLAGDIGTASGTNLNATIEAHETNVVNTSDNGPLLVGNSVWYQWTATQNGNATFNTLGSTDIVNNAMDTVLAIWTGNSVSNLC